MERRGGVLAAPPRRSGAWPTQRPVGASTAVRALVVILAGRNHVACSSAIRARWPQHLGLDRVVRGGRVEVRRALLAEIDRRNRRVVQVAECPSSRSLELCPAAHDARLERPLYHHERVAADGANPVLSPTAVFRSRRRSSSPRSSSSSSRPIYVPGSTPSTANRRPTPSGPARNVLRACRRGLRSGPLMSSGPMSILV